MVTILEIEEVKTMPYLSPAQRYERYLGLEEGYRDSLQMILTERFGSAAEDFIERSKSITDGRTLQKMVKSAVTAQSLEALDKIRLGTV